MSARKGWNIISRDYQKKTLISLEDVHYGPISSGELELKLLGNVKGKDVLEIGCGGGQNAIVLKKWGARSVGLDISDEQIRFARKLAQKEGAKVPFYVGNMEDLTIFHNDSFDVVLSSFAIGYADDLEKTFNEVSRVLRKNGLFVFADVHPIADKGRIVRFGKKRIWGITNYFDRKRYAWAWKQKERKAKFYGRHRTIQDYFNLLTDAGLVVEKILEPEPCSMRNMAEAERKKIPYLEEGFVKNYDLWKRVPYTIIFEARKSLLRK
jgi:ubiquinone/menaquinone biosynthesis C-methylase UbiE